MIEITAIEITTIEITAVAVVIAIMAAEAVEEAVQVIDGNVGSGTFSAIIMLILLGIAGRGFAVSFSSQSMIGKIAGSVGLGMMLLSLVMGILAMQKIAAITLSTIGTLFHVGWLCTCVWIITLLRKKGYSNMFRIRWMSLLVMLTFLYQIAWIM